MSATPANEAGSDETADPGGDGRVAEITRSVLRTLRDDAPGALEWEITRRDRHSNDVLEAHLDDGRILVVKCAPDPLMAARFRTSRVASDLLRENTDVIAPAYLDLESLGIEEPVLAYWWIPGATLRTVIRETIRDERRALLESWGGLIRRIHAVRPDGFGWLESADRHESLAAFLEDDLAERLYPAVEAEWPEALSSVQTMLRHVARIASACSEVGHEEPVLVHGDLYDQNVLCRVAGGPARCIGVLDLEDALAGPPELDLARTEVLHGALFGQRWAGEWFEWVLDGYRQVISEEATGFFRAYHLVNMGLHAGALGLDMHATQLAVAIGRELDALGSGRRHLEVVSEP